MAAQRLVIGRRLLQRILEHCLEEKPVEACGILAGRDGQVRAVFATDNARNSPIFFEVEREQQEEALRRIAVQGHELVGIYHSHPTAPAAPSSYDVEQAVHYPDAIRLIISLNGPASIGAYRICGERVEEVPLFIGDGPGGEFFDLRARWRQRRT
ncbi:MAG: M67 family metallopeptidase [Symbiobacterium sp.]|uniref:Mov34/MPN/PAD-1 family protein n=1 Tax=Symbiobacterium sp. TaxID=1971213 RepID=UPI003464670F